MISSRENIERISELTGFQQSQVEIVLTLTSLLYAFSENKLLKNAFALKGGTAINLFYYNLPRLSVDIDLNFIENANIDIMKERRPILEEEIKKIIQLKEMNIKKFVSSQAHAGGKCILNSKSALGGNYKIELDLNYIMRIPIWGTNLINVNSPDKDEKFAFNILSQEELYAGKIKALFDRFAPRDLFDIYHIVDLSKNFNIHKFRNAIILLGITSVNDIRSRKIEDVDKITQSSVDTELLPMLKYSNSVDLNLMKNKVKEFLKPFLEYTSNEHDFFEHFYLKHEYKPEIIENIQDADRLRNHPAINWKLLNLKKNN